MTLPPLGTSLSSGPRPAFQPLRILIADDDRDTVWTLMMILRDEGHAVNGVHSGDEVLKAVRLVGPDALVLDIGMPGTSGYAIAQELRALYYPARPPLLIAMSGLWVKTSDRILSQLVGFDHHLRKPVHPAELLGLLRPV